MICYVSTPQGPRLVRAKSNNASVDFVVAQTVTSRAVGADELVDLLASGMIVEDATTPEQPVTAADSEATANG